MLAVVRQTQQTIFITTHDVDEAILLADRILRMGIMCAIDFSMDIERQPDPNGDRVNVVLSDKFLPYKPY